MTAPKKDANPFGTPAAAGTTRRRKAGEAVGGGIPAGTESATTRGVGRTRKAYDIDNVNYRKLTLLTAMLKEDKISASDLVNEALELLFKARNDQLPVGERPAR